MKYIGANSDVDMLDLLTPRQRVIIHLYHGEGWSQEEVAKIIGLSQKIVSHELILARKFVWGLRLVEVNSASILIPSR